MYGSRITCTSGILKLIWADIVIGDNLHGVREEER